MEKVMYGTCAPVTATFSSAAVAAATVSTEMEFSSQTARGRKIVLQNLMV